MGKTIVDQDQLPKDATYRRALSLIMSQFDALERSNAQIGLQTGASSPDAPPAAPSAYDDEFNGTVLNPRWTLDANGAQGVLVHNSAKSRLEIVPNSTDLPVVLYQAAPAEDFTIDAKVLVGAAPGGNNEAAIFFRTASNAIESVHFTVNTSGQAFHRHIYTTIAGGVAFAAPTTSLSPYHNILYLRIQKIGSGIKGYYSYDGLFFRPFTGGMALTSAVVTHIGLYGKSTANSALNRSAFDYFRVT
jgi:hypothetical protein